MRWWLAALFMVTGCLAATQAIAERRVALVVGNSKYAHTSTLSNPRNDAEDIASALASVGFEVAVGYDLDQVKFAGTVAEFRDAIKRAKDATATTVVHVRTDLLGPNPPGSAWWDVPVSQVSELDSTSTAYADYLAAKRDQRPYLRPGR